MIIQKLGRGQGHSDPKMVCDTPPSEFEIITSKNIRDMHQTQC